MADKTESIRKVADFRLVSGKLRIADTSMFYDAYCDIDLSPGKYALSIIYDDDDVVAGFELTSETDKVVGPELSVLVFEFSQAGIFDQVQTEREFSRMDDMSTYYELLNNSDDFSVLRPTADLAIPFVRCSMGMGTIYPLLNAGKTVGVRVAFDVEDDEDEYEDDE